MSLIYLSDGFRGEFRKALDVEFLFFFHITFLSKTQILLENTAIKLGLKWKDGPRRIFNNLMLKSFPP